VETWVFYLFGGIALLSAVSVVAQRRVVYSAISLIVCLCALSGIYLLLKAQFIAAVQVIVYAGAIMVLFLFVIMLLDPFSPPILTDKRKQLGYVAVALGGIALVLLYPLLKAYDLSKVPREPGTPMPAGDVQRIGNALFTEYLLPFEVTSILILVGIIGAVILAKKQA
jgi:NADH-quinone oxidoreductase subunit J